MNIGDRIPCKVRFGEEQDSKYTQQTGTVVYIHPEGRYYTCEITVEGGTFRESYIVNNPKKLAEPYRSGNHWRMRAATMEAAQKQVREQTTLDGPKPSTYMSAGERENFRRTLIRIAGLDW